MGASVLPSICPDNLGSAHFFPFGPRPWTASHPSRTAKLRACHPQIVLERVREEGGGNVYRWTEKGMEGWLCPALLRYFEQAPAKLYVQVKVAVG